jgi:hypothetical protein
MVDDTVNHYMCLVAAKLVMHNEPSMSSADSNSGLNVITGTDRGHRHLFHWLKYGRTPELAELDETFLVVEGMIDLSGRGDRKGS